MHNKVLETFRFTRILVAWALVVCTAGTAVAQTPPWKRGGRRRSVYIDSSPQQAAVYIEDRAHGIACYTPCKVKLPYKQSFPVWLKKPGFELFSGRITVSRRRSERKYSFVLKRAIQHATLDVRSGPDNNAVGAAVHVDGVPLGTVPSQFKLKPGRHQVEAKKAGFKVWQEWVTLTERQVYTVVVIMVPTAKPKGSILVTSSPAGAKVYVDGQYKDTTPTIVSGLLPGDHTVEVRREGVPVWKQIVEVKANLRVKVHARLSVEKPRPAPGSKVGSIRILCNVPKADVYVDGDFKGQAPVTVKDLIPGDHLIEAKAKGYLPKEMRVKVAAMQQSLIKLDLEPKPVEKAVGTLRVQSEVPGAVVFLDGASIGKAPVEKKDIPTGVHIVVVRKPGFRDYKVKVDVNKGGVHVVTATLKAVGVIKVVTKVGGAEVLIDSAKVGTTPLAGYELEAGEYTLEVRRPGARFEPYRETFTIKGGEQRNFSISLRRMRRGPTPEQVAFIKTGLSSFGARTVPPKNFTTDVSGGFPYIFNAKLTVGAFKRGFFGIDAGISFRSLFMYMNEFAIHARGQLFSRGPFTAGLFTELGAGIGLDRRNSFFWNIGPVLSLSFKNLVTASLALWFNVYSDRFCRSSPADRDAGETEPDICQLTEAWPDNADGLGARDPSTYDSDADHRRNAPYQMYDDPENPGQSRAKRFNPKPFQTHSLRNRFSGWKFYITFSVEVALTRWLNVFLKLDFVPAQESQQRALFMEYFTASSHNYDGGTTNQDPGQVSTNGVMPKVDWGFYGQAGVSFKF